ncbi:MAG: Gfo/Idh/MocA family oxidoreductase [Euryarchaeota archaeon]|nr:Gfo/Idh/MocA family oxidoreductase [Euryarchaeota archaeon]
MLKIGVIGLGSMGKNHARVCSELGTVELVGVADIDKAIAKTIAERFDTKAFFNYKEMISEIDCAIIATPTITHHTIALDLLNHGKHVLIEKPITENTNKADELVKKSKKDGLVLAVGHIERHNPAVKFVKDTLVSGKFGELISLASKRVSNFPGRIKDVGVIFDFGIHDIDIMRYLAGDVRSVYARAGNFNKSISNEDHANIVLNFDNGICGVVEVNWLTPVKIRKLFLTGSEQFVEVDYIDQSVSMSASSFKHIDEMNLFNVPIQYNLNHVSLEKKEPLHNEIVDFVQAVEHGRKPLVTGEDGLIALKIAEAATRSYKKGEEVKII